MNLRALIPQLDSLAAEAGPLVRCFVPTDFADDPIAWIESSTKRDVAQEARTRVDAIRVRLFAMCKGLTVQESLMVGVVFVSLVERHAYRDAHHDVFYSIMFAHLESQADRRTRGIKQLPGTRSSRIRNALSALETLDGIASGAVPLVDSLKADGARNDVGALILAHEQE